MSPRRDRDRRPARPPPTRAPGRSILVVCEGERTEPEYLRGLIAHVKNPLVRITIAKERGEPRKVVEIARQLRSDAIERAAKEQDDNLAYDNVWCAFDRDQHERFDDALAMARANDLRLAVSNPCVELWLLLHFREQPGARDRADVARLLKQHLPSYEKGVRFTDFAMGLAKAEERAARLAADAAELGDGPHKNPTTGFYLLTRSIAGPAPERSRSRAR